MIAYKHDSIVGRFSCKGFDTFGPFKLIGGLSGTESVNHAVDFFHSSFDDRNGRGNGKKKRTVGVYEKKRKRSLSEASLRDRERFYLSAWKSRDGTYTGRLSPGKTVLSV